MLSIWWDIKGVVHYELLPENQTINSVVYCQQLDRLKEAIQNKRPHLAKRRGVTFQHDNARPHSSLATRKKLIEFFWDVVPHPAYSPDLAPSDYHLFRPLKQSLVGKIFESREDIENHLSDFFQNQDPAFWERGILDLPRRWAKVIEQNGTYLI